MELIKTATEKMDISMRGVSRVLRVARTIADLGGSQIVQREHIAEALGYRKQPFNKALFPLIVGFLSILFLKQDVTPSPFKGEGRGEGAFPKSFPLTSLADPSPKIFQIFDPPSRGG